LYKTLSRYKQIFKGSIDDSDNFHFVEVVYCVGRVSAVEVTDVVLLAYGITCAVNKRFASMWYLLIIACQNMQMQQWVLFVNVISVFTTTEIRPSR